MGFYPFSALFCLQCLPKYRVATSYLCGVSDDARHPCAWGGTLIKSAKKEVVISSSVVCHQGI